MFQNGKANVRQMTTLGLMSAITIIMVFSPFGMIPLPGISMTICHIPAIITAILFGPVSGMFVGFVFGASSLLRGLVAPQGLLDPLFINPLLSVAPRVLMGFVTYIVYKVVAKMNENAGIAAAAAAGSLTNTIVVLGLIYALYAKDIVEKIGMNPGPFVWAVFTSSGLIETVGAMIITFPLVKVLQNVARQKA